MKGKKFLSGMLALAVTATTVLPGAVAVKAEETTSTDSGILAQFTFDDEDTGFTGGQAVATKNGDAALSDEAMSGKALYLDGNGDYLNVTKNDESLSSLLTGQTAITVSYMRKYEGATGWSFFAAKSAEAQSDGAEYYVGTIDNNSSITVERYSNGRGNGSVKASGTYSGWELVTLVLDENKTTIYVNGEEQASTSNTEYSLEESLGDASVVQIGKANWGTGEYFKGYIDNFTIYDHAATADEIAAMEADFVKLQKAKEKAAEKATENVTVPDADSTYSFDDQTLGTAKAVVQGLGDYTGDVEYTTGRTEKSGDYAVKTGSYGVKLSDTNLGSNWSVNMWVKADSTVPTNTPVFFAGYHSPEDWVAISGDSGTQSCKVWTNDGSTYKWATVSTINVAQKWSMVTLTESNGTLSTYVDGQLMGSGSALDALNQENGSIWLGVSYWDPAFSGAYDDVNVYKSTLTADQVAKLYKDATTVKVLPDAVNTYEFDGELGTDTKAIVTGLTSYTGSAVYGQGRTEDEDDQAVLLGDYGLELPEKNIGKTWSVSMWLKPTTDIVVNSPALFLGYNSPEKWLAISGNDDKASHKVWTNDSNDSSFNWATLTNVTFTKNQWNHVTLTEDNGTVSIYVNGTKVGTGSAPDVLDSTTGGIYLGVSYWDNEFSGYVDDVEIYNSVLSASQVKYLYDGSMSDTIFAEGDFTATSELSLYTGRNKTITVNYPSSVSDDITLSYKSVDESVATVDENGSVTGVAAGETEITVTGTVGSTTKTATVKVTVSESAQTSELVVDYDLTKAVNGEIVDNSGKGNDATIHGTEGTDYSFVENEDGETVLKLSSNNAYLDLPTSIMDSLTEKEEFTIETTFAKSSACGNNAWLFCLGSNVKSTGTNYLFLSPNFSGTTLRTGIKNSSVEDLFSTAITPEVDKEYTVTMSFKNGTIKLYWNGVLIKYNNLESLESGYSIMDDVVTPGTSNDILGYIGKSCWSADYNYQGTISSFKIYDKALTDDEAQSKVFGSLFTKTMEKTEYLGKNQSADSVAYNLDLPTSYEEADITWVSSNSDIISASGVVTNPAENTEVTLTGTVTSGSAKASYEIKVTVVPADRTTLNTTLEKANAVLNNSRVSEDAKTKLASLVASADATAGQSAIDTLVSALERAIKNCEANYSELYKNPFTKVTAQSANSDETLSLKAGETASIYTVDEEVKDMVKVTYSSSNEAVAKYADGVVTAVAAGYAVVTTTVTADYDGYAVEYQRLVYVTGQTAAKTTEETTLDMTGVSASLEAEALAVKGTTKVVLTIPDAVAKAGVTTSYSATGAVSVSEDGTVTAVKAGTGKVFVKITASNKTVTKALTIKAYEITGKKSVKKGKKITLKVSGASSVKWSVNNKKLAKISSKGVLKGLKKGTVKVTATVDGLKLTYKVKVK